MEECVTELYVTNILLYTIICSKNLSIHSVTCIFSVEEESIYYP